MVCKSKCDKMQSGHISSNYSIAGPLKFTLHFFPIGTNIYSINGFKLILIN